jgi:hypothetical protein
MKFVKYFIMMLTVIGFIILKDKVSTDPSEVRSFLVFIIGGLSSIVFSTIQTDWKV